MSGVEWLGQVGSCPPGWTALPNNLCTRQGEGGWPEYRCVEGYVRDATGTNCLRSLPPTVFQPSPPAVSERRGSVVPALLVLGVAAGIFYAVVR